jgi:hypothetical protein
MTLAARAIPYRLFRRAIVVARRTSGRRGAVDQRAMDQRCDS